MGIFKERNRVGMREVQVSNGRANSRKSRYMICGLNLLFGAVSTVDYLAYDWQITKLKIF
jgi:hypothetical protein